VPKVVENIRETLKAELEGTTPPLKIAEKKLAVKATQVLKNMGGRAKSDDIAQALQVNALPLEALVFALHESMVQFKGSNGDGIWQIKLAKIDPRIQILLPELTQPERILVSLWQFGPEGIERRILRETMKYEGGAFFDRLNFPTVLRNAKKHGLLEILPNRMKSRAIVRPLVELHTIIERYNQGKIRALRGRRKKKELPPRKNANDPSILALKKKKLTHEEKVLLVLWMFGEDGVERWVIRGAMKSADEKLRLQGGDYSRAISRLEEKHMIEVVRTGKKDENIITPVTSIEMIMNKYNGHKIPQSKAKTGQSDQAILIKTIEEFPNGLADQDSFFIKLKEDYGLYGVKKGRAMYMASKRGQIEKIIKPDGRIFYQRTKVPYRPRSWWAFSRSLKTTNPQARLLINLDSQKVQLMLEGANTESVKLPPLLKGEKRTITITIKDE